MPLLEERGPPLDESRLRKSIAHSAGPRVSTLELGASRTEWADNRRTFAWGRVCDEIVDIEIDNTTDCNLISEGMPELLGYKYAVRRFNGKLAGTFNGKG